MIIESLQFEYSGQKIITDIDDCIIYTSKSIREHGIKKRKFWFNNEIYERNKHSVLKNAMFTEWGLEFIEMLQNGSVKDYEFITAAKNRIDILIKKFGIDSLNIKEGMSNADKIEYLNKINVDAIYVDDRIRIIKSIDNVNVCGLNYPEELLQRGRWPNNYKYRRKRRNRF